MGKTELNIYHIDTCLPCYFLGCGEPYVQVAIHDSRMSAQELREALIGAINAGWVSRNAGEDERWCERAVDAINRAELPAMPFSNLYIGADEEEGDVGETACAFFRIVEEPVTTGEQP